MSNYQFIWGNTQGVFTIEGDMLSASKYRKIEWNRLDSIISVSRDNRISSYISNKDVINNNERGKLWFNKRYVKNFFKEVKQACKDHKALFRKLKKTKFSKLTDSELHDLLNETINRWAITISYFRASQMEGTRYLVDKVIKATTPEESAIILLPPELDPINKEQIDWKKGINGKYTTKKVLAHAEKHPWLVAYHFTMEDVIHTLVERFNYDKKNLNVGDIKHEKAVLKGKQGKLLKKYPEIKGFVDTLHRIALSRIELKSYWGGTDFYLIPLFREISKRTGENPRDIAKYYLVKEVRELLKGKKLSEEEKRKRKDCFVFLWKNRKVNISSGREAEELAKNELQELYGLKEIKELIGNPANPGKITGIARVLEANNIEKARVFRKSFKKGEILITEMTQPAIIDIAKKAGAIVTDEGGMLSHAAIISREFKIPCIVGTHFATKAIKDGMKIEVDANKGIIRKL